LEALDFSPKAFFCKISTINMISLPVQLDTIGYKMDISEKYN
jgi:hypothetical protein